MNQIMYLNHKLVLLISGVVGVRLDHIFAFGDSYTDYENLFEMTQFTKPDPRYFYEGRTSNGPTWLEAGAKLFEKPPNVTSFAVGGATTDSTVFAAAVPGAKQQVETGFESYYVKNSKYVDRVLNQSMVTFSFGGNDFFIPGVDAIKVAALLAEAMARLLERHPFKRVLYTMSNALSYTPFVRSLPDPTRSDILRKCAQFKSESIKQVAVLKSRFPNTIFIEFDAGGFWGDATSKPNPITNRPWIVNQGCLKPRTVPDLSSPCPGKPYFEPANDAPGCSRMPANMTALIQGPAFDICPNPNEHVFWDGSHPTAEMHRSIARHMLHLVNQSGP